MIQVLNYHKLIFHNTIRFIHANKNALLARPLFMFSHPISLSMNTSWFTHKTQSFGPTLIRFYKNVPNEISIFPALLAFNRVKYVPNLAPVEVKRFLRHPLFCSLLYECRPPADSVHRLG